jgi:hypothetical protein
MTENITSALIIGLFSILVALISIYHQDILSIIRFRKRRLDQRPWRGQGIEIYLSPDSGKPLTTYDIVMEFEQTGSLLTGRGSGTNSSGEYYAAKLRGKMEDEYFITLTAYSVSSQEFDIALMLLELDAKGNKLHGYALASGLSDHGITLSKISLTQEPS